MQIVYEYAASWPDNGPLHVTVPTVSVDIPVSPEVARRRANGYLGMHVGLLLGTSNPQLVIGEHPLWQLAVNLHLPAVGFVGQVGVITVDATTGNVCPLSTAVIKNLQERAHDLTLHFTPATAAAS